MNHPRALLVLATTLLHTLVAAQTSEARFTDPFDSGPSESWSVSGGEWQVVEGALEVFALSSVGTDEAGSRG